MLARDVDFASRILDSMSSGVIAIDSAYAVVMMNDGAKRILGCRAGEGADALGTDCRKVLGNQPVVAQLLIDALDAHSPLSRAELVLESVGDRDRSTIGFTLSPVRDERSRICGAAMIFRDLTPFERMDEQDRLRERLTALGQMAADLAHEIRNPLAGMQVVAGLLKRRMADRPDDRDLVDQIIVELGSVAGTISASLDFVSPVSVQRQPLDPVAMLESAIGIARTRVAFDGAIERRIGSDLPPIEGDVEQLRSVLTNLIVNALEAMASCEPGRIAVLSVSVECVASDRSLRSVRVNSDGVNSSSQRLAARELVIAISDTGDGVPVELQEKVFYPFFTTKATGSGIGLATAQKVAASHGGMIELESEASRGTTFRLRLPVLAAEGGAARPTVAPSEWSVCSLALVRWEVVANCRFDRAIWQYDGNGFSNVVRHALGRIQHSHITCSQGHENTIRPVADVRHQRGASAYA
jgi:nitrogen-specific signal transduction histidine kinase